MQPIFTEFINFMKDKGYDIPITEGTYWLDNGFIKAYTPDGVLHKLYKYKVFDDLSIKVTKYKEYIEADFETWTETAERLSDDVNCKVEESLKAIKHTMGIFKDMDTWVLTSTGKDSMVVLYLVQKIIPDVKVMFNNTSLDVADTYKMVKSHPEWVVTNPKIGFYKWVKQQMFIPTRFSRACCNIFKEGASISYFREHNADRLLQFMGVRNEESNTRSNRRFVEHNPKWTNPNWLSCLPIRKWTELDVWLYIIRENLEINPKYRKGYSRVGCGIACPYYTKSTWILDKYWYPNLYKRWHEIVEEDFLSSRRWCQLNCTVKEYHVCWNGGLYRPEPTEEVIQEMCDYTGTDREVAVKYFNKTCCECGANVRQREVLGMNYKYFGTDSNVVYCKKCLKKKFNLNTTQWKEQVSKFNEQGCTLF